MIIPSPDGFSQDNDDIIYNRKEAAVPAMTRAQKSLCLFFRRLILACSSMNRAISRWPVCMMVFSEKDLLKSLSKIKLRG